MKNTILFYIRFQGNSSSGRAVSYSVFLWNFTHFDDFRNWQICRFYCKSVVCLLNYNELPRTTCANKP